jgi:hypothetical protein
MQDAGAEGSTRTARYARAAGTRGKKADRGPSNNSMQLTTGGSTRMGALGSARQSSNEGKVVRPSQLMADSTRPPLV